MSEILNVHQRTLRIWDKEGILVPKRTDKNRRYYLLEDIKRAEFVLFLTRNLLINLAAVKIILRFLELSEVESENYIDYINKIAALADITSDKQKENMKKSLRRGRSKKI